MSKESRIKSLRAKLDLLRPKYPPPPDMFITFVGSDGNGHLGPDQEITYATISSPDGSRFDRKPGETVRDFRARVVASLERHPSLVFLHSEETRLIAEPSVSGGDHEENLA